jgi:membrane-bound lytic murein transglycosylase B
MKKTGLLVLLFLMLSHTAQAQQDDAFASWMHDMEQEALSNGVSQATVKTALEPAMLDDRVVTLDQKQPETTVTFDAYSRRTVSDSRVQMGQQLEDKFSNILDTVSQRYGVQPQIILALWAVESSYGRYPGDYSIVDSLVTLAYEGRRADFFRKELINTLKIIDRYHVPPDMLRGSWAGAMGQCQFMPSTYLKYAVDYDGDGYSDIWTNTGDVLASIANYIASEGWRSDQTWGREVSLDDDIPAGEIGLDHQHTLAEWSAMGVKSLNGSPLPNKPLSASLIQPDGADGRSFLVYDNFRALMRWNRSTYFATSVGLLADRIQQ